MKISIAQIQKVIANVYRAIEQTIAIGDSQVESNKALVSRFGHVLIADDLTLYRQQFSQPTFDATNQAQTAAGAGAVVMTGVTQKLTSGVGAADAITVSSVRPFGSFPGYVTSYSRTLIASANSVGNVRTWGLFSGAAAAPMTNAALANGYGFQLDGTAGTFRAIVLKAGVVSQFIDLTTDPTKWHTYNIRFNGALQVEFYVDHVLVGSFTSIGTALVLTSSAVFFSYTENHNTAVQALAPTTESSAVFIMTQGATDQLNQSFQFNANGVFVAKVGPGIMNALNIMKAGTGGNTVNIWDNTTNAGRLLYSIPGGESPRLPDMDLPFAIGLTVESVGAISATGTVEYS